MKTKLLVATLIAGSSLFAETHFSIGIGVGGHGYAAPPVMAYRSHSPGPGYIWVDGYWDRVGPRRFWRAGYWARPSYGRGFAIAPRYDGNRYNDDRRDSNARSRPNENSYNGIPNGGPFANSANGGFPSGANGINSSGNRSGNFSNGSANRATGNLPNGTSGTGYNGNGSNGNNDVRFYNPNGRR